MRDLPHRPGPADAVPDLHVPASLLPLSPSRIRELAAVRIPATVDLAN